MKLKRAKVVMLPTNEKSKLVLSFKEKSFNQLTEPKLTLIEEANYQLSNIQSQHLYFISDDKIKEGDWWLNKDDNSLNNDSNIAHLANNASSCKKIISTTDSSLKIAKLSAINYIWKDLSQPSQAFIEKYVEKYNKGDQITDVLVEYVDNGHEDWCERSDQPIWVEKLVPYINHKDNTITIKKVKDSWNRNEVMVLLGKAQADGIIKPTVYSDLFDKWIEENL